MLAPRQTDVPTAASPFGVVDTTPTAPVVLFGRGGRTAPFARIDTGLEANLVVLRGADDFGNVAIVGIDTLFAGAALKRAVMQRLEPEAARRFAHIIFVATHTHNAPALDPTKPLLGRCDPDHLAFVAGQIAALLRQAARTELAGAARLTRGAGRCALNALRRKRGLRLTKQPPFVRVGVNFVPVHSSEVPRAVELLVAYDQAGAAIWAVWSWCCHATSHPDASAVSPDFPGVVRAHLRHILGAPDLPVVFLPGFCGDIRPDPSLLPIDPRSVALQPFARPFANATPTNFRRLCSELCRAVDTALEVASEVAAPTTASAGLAEVPLERLIADFSSNAEHPPMEVVAIDAGGFGMLLVGAEVCSPYLERFASLVPVGWLVSGYAGDVFGYLPSDRQVHEGGYEGGEFFGMFGFESGRFRPAIEAVVVDAACRAAEQACAARGQH